MLLYGLRAVLLSVFKKNSHFRKKCGTKGTLKTPAYMPYRNKSTSAAVPILSLFSMLLTFFLGVELCSCALLPSLEKGPRLYTLGQASDTAEFAFIIKSSYKKPKGVLPDLFYPAIRESKVKGGFVYSSSFTSHEFFVFDHQGILLLLSIEPIAFHRNSIFSILQPRPRAIRTDQSRPMGQPQSHR